MGRPGCGRGPGDGGRRIRYRGPRPPCATRAPRSRAARGVVACATALLFAGALGPPLPALGKPGAEPPARRVLADFEKDPGFHVDAQRAADELVPSLAPDPSGARPGRSLHLGFRFGPGEAGDLVLHVKVGDVDATGFDHLAFRVRGDAEAGFGPALKIRLLRIAPDAVQTGSFVVDGITGAWRRVVVPLNRMPGLRGRTHLRELIVMVQPRRVGVTSGGYWLDDVELLRTGAPGPGARDPVAKPLRTAWERAAGGPAALRLAQRGRLRGWPQRLSVPPAELPTDPEAFLRRLARDTWKGLDALTDRKTGLPVDDVYFGPDTLAPATANIGDFTSLTNVGLQLMAIAAAPKLGLVSSGGAQQRAARVIDTLERLEGYHGFLFNYYDTVTAERSSQFVSFVDSAWLTAGLMVTRVAFPELAPRCKRLLDRQDYGFFYDPVERLMSHGYWPRIQVPAEYHYGEFYSEARLGSLLAVGKGDVPEQMWLRMARVLRALAGGAGAPPGALHRWRGTAFVPSWGGSMFEALMPTLVVDEPGRAPRTLGQNDRAHAEIQRRYARQKLGLAVWGMSPSADPAAGRYAEYGVPVLGEHGYRPGVVAPYAAALALAVTPRAAEADLRRLAASPGLYGEYGLYDALDPATGRVARAYLALDQSMIFLALANRLEDGCVQKMLAADPIAARALPLVSDERILR